MNFSSLSSFNPSNSLAAETKHGSQQCGPCCFNT